MRRLIPVFLLVTVPMAAACSRGGGAAALPPALTISQSATVMLTASESRSNTASKLVIEVTTPVGNPTSTDGKAPRHGTFERVAVGLQLKSGAVTYDPRDFEVQAPDGGIYRASDGHSDADAFAQLTKSPLAAGPGISGNIVIDTTETAAAHGLLLYKPGHTVLAAWRY